MKKEAIEFRPLGPSLRDLLPVGFLALLLVLLAGRAVVRPGAVNLAGLAGLGLLVLGGCWLQLRGRFPGDPRLRVDGKGMAYRVGKKERALAWKDLEAMLFDFTLDRILFVPKEGGRPIATRIRMVADDGREWLMLMDNYWQPPQGEPRRTRP